MRWSGRRYARRREARFSLAPPQRDSRPAILWNERSRRNRKHGQRMKVATWNVNGIRARATQVREWLEREQPDVVCMQELKAELIQIPEVCQLADYHAYWHCCKGYSGVSLQVRRELFSAEPV